MLNLEELKTSYDKTSAIAARFADRLAEQVDEIITSKNVSLAVPIEKRVKTWQSISDKVSRQKLQISDVAGLNDFIGIRVILLFKRDLELVLESLATALSITSTEDTLERLGVETFGYQSIHLQARMPENWAKVPTLKDFSGLQAEIQVRTAAQHIWAVASHKLQYKMEASVPRQVLRSVNRVAALLETVDLEFERALIDRENYVASASASLNSGDMAFANEALNVDLIKKILDAELPIANRTDDESYDEVLAQLQELGVNTATDLVRFIHKYLPDLLVLEREIVRHLRKHANDVGSGNVGAMFEGIRHSTTEARLRDGLYHSHSGFIEQMVELEQNSREPPQSATARRLLSARKKKPR